MKPELYSRLNQILPRITSDDFLASDSIGNEIACYIFDYDADEEPQVRDYLGTILERLASHHSNLHVLHLNLLDVIIAYLEKRGLFEKAIAMEHSKGDTGLLKALKGPLTAEKLRDFIEAEYHPGQQNCVLISGVGNAWPLLRVHSLLNCLHTIMGQTPLVLFYPGRFDGKTLRLFGGISSDSTQPNTDAYYRAFSLIPRETIA